MTKHRTAWRAMLWLCLVCAPVSVYADPIPLQGFGPFLLRPGDVLRAEFDVSGLDPLSFQPANVLLFAPGVAPIQPIGSYTTRLYDGGTLLGTYTASAGGVGPAGFLSWFKAPGTIFTLGNPTVVDFTSINNGTFDGAVEFEIQGGLANIFRVSDELDLDVALGPNLASGSGFAPRTFEIIPAAATPEPASLLLFATGAGLTLRRRRR